MKALKAMATINEEGQLTLDNCADYSSWL